jgi:hypothetical protein
MALVMEKKRAIRQTTTTTKSLYSKITQALLLISTFPLLSLPHQRAAWVWLALPLLLLLLLLTYAVQ